MTSKTLVVFYEDKSTQAPAPAPTGTKGAAAKGAAPMQSATPGPGGASSIKRLEAKGNVVVTQKDQVVTGETAIFDTKTNLITMLGGGGSQVVLTQCQNVLRGDRLLVDMIITGGFNVYSIEVENALRAHEAVQDCAVIGLPDDKWGERIVAVVQPRAGHTVEATALAAFVKQQIGSVKTPKQIEVWDDLPRSKVGKVLKPDIRARLVPR